MSEYGMQIFRADGSVALDSRETVLRLVHIERISGTFAGTFSVPEFDGAESGGVFTGQGFFYVQNDVLYLGQGGFDPFNPIFGSFILPTLSWDNSSKTMTVTPRVFPSGYPFQFSSSYDVIFCHFR